MKIYNIKKGNIRLMLITVFASLVILFCAWIADTLYAVHLPVEDQQVELYSTEMQDDLSLIISKAIDGANTSVTLIIYSLTDKNIIRSLREKADAGVPVRLIIESKTSPWFEKKLGPNVKILKRFINGLSHIKMLIIDEKQIWIGSANMTEESLRHYGNLMIAINSKQMAEMATAKASTLTATERMQQITHRSFNLGQQSAELWFLPDDPMAIKEIKSLIRSAKKTIRIAMFAWTRRDLAHEVVSAKKRGINVEVILDRNLATGTGAVVTRMLAEGGINVKLNNGATLLHHKFLIIDNDVLLNGSANWTKNAFQKNDDCFVVIRPLLEGQQKFLNDMWQIIDHDSSKFIPE